MSAVNNKDYSNILIIDRTIIKNSPYPSNVLKVT